MTVDIIMGLDGVLRVVLSGDLDSSIVESLRRQFSPYVEAATAESPLKSIITFQQLGIISFATRHYLTQLNQDPRCGAIAYMKPPRKARVLAQFIQKGSKRENIRFFEAEEDALEWLYAYNPQPVTD